MFKLIRVKYEEKNIKGNKKEKKEYLQKSNNKPTMKAQRQLNDNFKVLKKITANLEFYTIPSENIFQG